MNLQVQPNLNRQYLKLIQRVSIASSGMYLPEKIVHSDDLLSQFDSMTKYGIPVDSLSSKVGILERRMASEDEEPSTLAINAALQALEAAGVSKVDKVVFCGIMKDQEEPATAHKINDKLKLNARDAYDITDACFGFIRGLQDCIRSIQLGDAKSALVLTGETPSKGNKDFINQLKSGVDKGTAKKILGFLTAGDAGGAILLQSSDPNYSRGFGKFETISNSKLWDKCYYKIDRNGRYTGQMMMGHLTAHGKKLGQELVNRVISAPDWIEPDHVLSHNTGRGSFDGLVEFGLAPREKWFKTYEKLGNLMSATFPVNYHLRCQSDAFKSGDRIAGLFNGSGLIFGHFEYIC